MFLSFYRINENLAMETEIEQEGNENAWRTADMRIRKTQVPAFLKILFQVISACVFVLNVVSYCGYLLLFFNPYYRIRRRSRTNSECNSSTNKNH